MRTCVVCSGTGRIYSVSGKNYSSSLCPSCAGVGWLPSPTRSNYFSKKKIGGIIGNGIDKLVYTLKYFKRLFLKQFDKEKFLEAASEGNIGEVVSFLATDGNVNCREASSGACALHYAAAHDAVDVVEALLSDHRIDVLTKDNNGRLASELAFMFARNEALGDRLIEVEAAARHANNKNAPSGP